VARLEPVVLLALAGCGSAATNNHPEHAFARLRIAIESGDARRLYEALELTTQWSVMSIHRAERGMWRRASRFPQGPREVAIARYDAAGRADGPVTQRVRPANSTFRSRAKSARSYCAASFRVLA